MSNWEFPKLDLTFAEHGGNQFLVDASFRLNEASVASRRLVVKPPRGKYFRAMCILMLLAKYRGESFADEDGMILFSDKIDRLTWIKALGTSFGKAAQQEFFRTYFQNCKFLSAGRGSGHKAENKKDGNGVLPSAKYHARLLLLRNLKLCKRTRGSAELEPPPMSDEEMALLAEKLERREVEKSGGWKPIVSEIIADTKRDRPLKLKSGAEIIASERSDEPQPFILSARWRELFHQVRNGMEGGAKGDDWYVVSLVPAWVLEWKEVLCDAVTNHDAKVKVVYHSPTAAKNSLAIEAQWRVNSSRVDPNEMNIVNYISKRLNRLKGELSGWVEETKKSPAKRRSKGSFEYFESYVTHPFMGILAVPSGSKRSSTLTSVAPPGTWCVISLYPFYQANVDNRCGLYLNGPSPMLDIYYNSILDFFERGPKDGYLKAVDLPKSLSGKGQKSDGIGTGGIV